MTHAILLDTECSGTDPFTDRVVSAYLALVDLDDPSLTPIREQSWVMWPGYGFEMPAEATAVNGFTTERLAAEQTTSTWEGVLQIIKIMEAETLPIVAFNAGYDLSILWHEAKRANIPTAALESAVVLDPSVLWRRLEPNRRGGWKLIDAVAFYHLHLGSDYHEARFDAIAAGHVLRKQLNHDLLRGLEPQIIFEASGYWRNDQEIDYAKYRRRTDPNWRAQMQWPIHKTKEAS